MHIAQHTFNGAKGLDPLGQVSPQHHIGGRFFSHLVKVDYNGGGTGDDGDGICERA